MSLHRSLRSTGKMRRHRSVLNRLEKLKSMMAKGTWNEQLSPLGLPKVRNIKVTIKKEKAAAAAPGAEGAPAAPGAPSGAAAGAAPAKGEAAKPKKTA